MKSTRTLRSVLPFVALALGTAVVLGPEPARAAKALFRVERKFFGAPFPAIVQRTHTTMSMIEPTNMKIPLYGGAGRFENFIEPATMTPTNTATPTWYKALPAGVATVASMNPVGAAFTLPRSFIAYQATTKAYSSTAFTGYTSFSYVTYVNGRARFRPNNPYGPTMTARAVFPTTAGNKAPVQGNGSPVTSTTTFGGDFDFSRAGSINVDPGPNRFGGTMRILYDTNTSKFYQYIGYFNPLFFKAYGTFNCLYMNVTCTEDLETRVNPIDTATMMLATPNLVAGQITSTGMVSRFLLDPTVFTNTAGTTMIGRTMYRKIADPPVVSKAYYLHLLAPWTTGKVGDYNVDSMYKIAPTITGYDKNLGGADVTVTRTSTTATYMGGKVIYSYMTTKQYLMDVTRVVSLVRPRLIHTYLRPRIETDPLQRNFTAARLWTMNVYFLPEPGELLLLGSGIAGLAGLAFLRRR